MTREDFNRNLDLLLGQRVDRLLELVDNSSKLVGPTKDELKSLWTEAKGLAVWRNRITHNLVLPTWKSGSDSECAPPDLLGVPDMKQLKVSNVTDSISIEGINKLIDESANLGQRIHAVTSKLQAE